MIWMAGRSSSAGYSTILGRAQFMETSMRQENGPCGVLKQVACCAPEDRFAETRMAIGPHHKQIGVLVCHEAVDLV